MTVIVCNFTSRRRHKCSRIAKLISRPTWAYRWPREVGCPPPWSTRARKLIQFNLNTVRSHKFPRNSSPQKRFIGFVEKENDFGRFFSVDLATLRHCFVAGQGQHFKVGLANRRLFHENLPIFVRPCPSATFLCVALVGGG